MTLWSLYSFLSVLESYSLPLSRQKCETKIFKWLRFQFRLFYLIELSAISDFHAFEDYRLNNMQMSNSTSRYALFMFLFVVCVYLTAFIFLTYHSVISKGTNPVMQFYPSHKFFNVTDWKKIKEESKKSCPTGGDAIMSPFHKY